MKKELLIYYMDMLGKKFDQQSEWFWKRIEALKMKDAQQAEFIENMKIEPLETQIKYLSNKLIGLIEEKKI